jgi:hypothetical protein
MGQPDELLVVVSMPPNAYRVWRFLFCTGKWISGDMGKEEVPPANIDSSKYAEIETSILQ